MLNFNKFQKFILLVGLVIMGHGGFGQNNRNQTAPVSVEQKGEVFDTTVFYGRYNGHDISIRTEDSVGCFIKKLIIDGHIMKENFTTSKIEQDGKDDMSAKKGDSVVFKIIHRRGCTFNCSNEAIKKKIKK